MKLTSDRKRFPIWELLTAALFSFFMVFGSAFESSGDYRFLFADWSCCLLTAGQFLLWFVLLFAGISFLFSHWDAPAQLPSGRGMWEKAPAWIQPILRLIRRWADLLYRRPVTVTFLTLLIKNIPYFIVSYPGLFMGDTQSQMGQLMGTATVSNHHPLIHTALMGLFLKLRGLLGWNGSIFLYSLFQALLLLAVISLCIRTLVRLRCRKWITLSILLFYLFHPRIESYLFLVSKDVIYTAFFVLFVLLLFRFVDKEAKMTRSEWVLFALSIVGTVFFRSEGKLIVIGTLVPALFIKRKPVRRQAAALLLLALLSGSFVTNVVCPAMGAKTITDTKEMLSVPFQQTARYVLEYGDEVTEEERQAIDAVLDYDSLAENYNPSLSDPVKSTYKKNGRALPAYFRVWFQMLCKHPGVYIRATMNNYYQYFYPGSAAVGKYTYRWSAASMVNTNNATGQTGFSYPQSTEDLRTLLEQYRDTIFQSPVLSLVYQSAIYTWLAILCIVYTLRKRSLAGFVGTMPMVVQILIFITGPTNGYYGRYQFPMLIYLPMVLVLLPRMLASEKPKGR